MSLTLASVLDFDSTQAHASGLDFEPIEDEEEMQKSICYVDFQLEVNEESRYETLRWLIGGLNKEATRLLRKELRNFD